MLTLISWIPDQIGYDGAKDKKVGETKNGGSVYPKKNYLKGSAIPPQVGGLPTERVTDPLSSSSRTPH